MKKKISYKWFTNLLLAVAALTLSASLVSTAWAQSTTDGAIGGTVYDQSGAVIPGASVTAHNNGTNGERMVTSDASGNYILLHLAPSVYTVTVAAKGFQTFRGEQVTVTVGSVTTVLPHMTLGSTAQTVTVSGVASQVNTTSADFAHTLNQTAIANLPIQRPRWSNFALLTPGVVSNYDGFGLLSFRGMAAVANGNTIDGANNVQAFFSEERGRTRLSYSSSQTAIQEFQVNTSNYSSEYGSAAGGVINTVTKSGTNQFHGDIFFKNRENGWASRNPFALIAEPTASGSFASLPLKPKDYWDMWGFAVGGPIKRDKLFFFFAYDGFFRNFPGIPVATSPTVFFTTPFTTSQLSQYGGTCSASGALSGFTASSLGNAGVANATNVYNSTQGACAIAGIIAPGNASYANGYNDYLAGLNNLATNLGPNARTGKQNIFFPKLDWTINSKHRLSVEANRTRWASPYGVQTQVTNNYSNGSAFGNDYVQDTWGVAKLISIFTPNIANEVRFQTGRDLEFESAPPPNAYEVNTLYKTSTSSSTYPSWTNYTNPFGVPTYVSLTNGFNFGTAYYDLRPKYPDEMRTQIADTVTWTHGNHTIKTGADFNHVKDQIAHLYQQVGQYNYGSVSAYLEDLYAPTCATGNTSVPCATHYNSYAQAFGPLGFTFATNDVALFGQDDWKIMPRFTLSFGMRWELQTLPAPIFPNPAVPGTTKYPDTHRDFAPRLGFAWDVFGNGKTSVRGGAGIYYGRVINGTIFSLLTQSGLVQNGVPAGQPGYSFSNAAAGGPYFPQVIATVPTSGAAKPSTMFLNANFKNPQIDEVDLSVERTVGWNTVVSVSYMGGFGHFLPQYTDDNVIPCGNGVTCPTSGSGTTALTAPPSLTYSIAKGGALTSTTYTTPLYSVRPNTSYNQMIDIFGVNSNYNALVLAVNHRYSKSIQFNANYTWSHALDYNPANGTTLTASSGYAMFAPNNVGGEYGNSNNNVPSRFVFNMILMAPWHVNGPLKYLANGWQLAPIFQAQSGLDYSIGTSGTAPGAAPSGGGINGSDGAFRLGPRNIFTMRGTQNLDLRLSKTIPIKEKVRLELMGEAFNLFNHFNATGVNSTGYSVTTSGSITDSSGATQTCGNLTAGNNHNPCLTPNSAFGTFSSANSNFIFSTRQIQIGMFLHF